MTEEEKAAALAGVDREMATREVYRNVYKSDEAIATIAQMMDDAGYFSMNPDTVNPQLVAQVNRLLKNMGAVHPLNVFNFAKAIVQTSNDEDLHMKKTALATVKED